MVRNLSPNKTTYNILPQSGLRVDTEERGQTLNPDAWGLIRASYVLPHLEDGIFFFFGTSRTL